MSAAALLDRVLGEASPEDEPRWVTEARDEARRWLAAKGLPGPRDEAWKYTPLADVLDGLPGAVDSTGTSGRHGVRASVVDSLLGVPGGGARLVFVDGVHHPGLSAASTPDGVTCTSLSAILHSTAWAPRFPGLWDGAQWDGFRALNQAAATDAALVSVASGRRATLPVKIVHLSLGEPTLGVRHPRTFIEVGEGASVTVVERYLGSATTGLTNAATTVVAGPGAHVGHHRVQQEGGGVTHLGTTAIRQAAGSDVTSTSVMLGGGVARHAIAATLDGSGATVRLSGLNVTTADRRHDHTVDVTHAASQCQSSQLFKGVVADRGRGSFSGRILVPADTTATEAHQTTRSLLLGSHAQADARPWLEILADDVVCTHGAAVGQLDDDAMFYLRSRGIPPSAARALLVTAFVREVLDTVDVPDLRVELEAAVTEALDAVGDADGGASGAGR